MIAGLGRDATPSEYGVCPQGYPSHTGAALPACLILSSAIALLLASTLDAALLLHHAAINISEAPPVHCQFETSTQRDFLCQS